MLTVQLLLHLPSPQKLANDQAVMEYSLILLDSNARHFWLNSVILILYKVFFSFYSYLNCNLFA